MKRRRSPPRCAGPSRQERVVEQTAVSELIVVFVNDGSTDRTQEIVDAPEFGEVVKVRFEKNRGYGAAIKAGWDATDADLVGFMDADGTCDPNFCVNLINRLEETKADVVLGSRLGADTKMPAIRQLGNRLFASLLGAVSGQNLTDSASGFRIVRRSSRKLLSPLPDGLHFTPAMSSICLLDPRLRIEEIPMPYEERTGASKLSVLKDGLRFLFIILFTTSVFNPIRSFLFAALIAAIGFGIIAGLISLLDPTSGLLPLVGLAALCSILLLIGTGVLVHQLNFLLLGPIRRRSPAEQRLQRLLNFKELLLAGIVLTAISVAGWLALAASGLNSALYAVPISALMVLGLMLMLGGVAVRVIWVVGQRQAALSGQSEPPTPLNTEQKTSAMVNPDGMNRA